MAPTLTVGKTQLASLPVRAAQPRPPSAPCVRLPSPVQHLLSTKTKAVRPGASLVVHAQAAATAVQERTSQKTATPASLGYTMPGEFEKHAGCWMGWPDSPYLWRENAKPAQKEYTAIANAISQFEPVTMYANPESADDARAAFKDNPKVTVVELPICDGWTRDWGPSCIARDVDGKREVAGVHWDFDCYGGTIKKKLGQPTQVPDWSKDAVAGRTILEMNGLQVFEAPLHLEGGSIHSDGEGTLVCTEECLLHPSRNPHLGREGIEQVLKDYLGLKKIIWLWKGIAGDDAITNGHVDNFCCFARPGTVLLAWTDDQNDPQWERSNRAYDVLSTTTDAKGRKLEIIKIPCPPPLFRTYKEAEGVHPDHIKLGYCPRIPEERLPATYINHYVANGGVVMPSFGGPGLARATELDGLALEALQKAYPDRKVVAVKSRDVLLNAGNIHCITQQFPAAW